MNSSDTSKIAVNLAAASLINFGVVELIAIPAMISNLIAGPNPRSRKLMLYADRTSVETLFDFDSNEIIKSADVVLDHADLPYHNAGFSFDGIDKLKELFGRDDNIDASISDMRTFGFVLSKDIATKLGLDDPSISDGAMTLVTQGKSTQFLVNMVDNMAADTIDNPVRAMFLGMLNDAHAKPAASDVHAHANGADHTEQASVAAE